VQGGQLTVQANMAATPRVYQISLVKADMNAAGRFSSQVTSSMTLTVPASTTSATGCQAFSTPAMGRKLLSGDRLDGLP
jgi:hypothetical protein